MNNRNKKFFILLGIVAAAIILIIPQVVTMPYVLHIIIMTFYIASASMCWSVLGGITGQMSLGHACFMAMGAYVTSMLIIKLGISPWIGAPIAMLFSGCVATILFYPCFGLRGPYFTLATLAFAEAIRNLIINWQFAGGAQGISLPFGEDSFLLMRFMGKQPYYYIAFGMIVIISIAVFLIGRSRLGFALKTIREDEDTANSIGINPQKYKAIAVFISAALISLCGVFYSQYLRYIDPDIMLQTYSIEFVLPAIIGGINFTMGPLLGAVILVPLSEILRSSLSRIFPGINIIVYAIALILIICFQPKGLLGWYQNHQIKKRRNEAMKVILGESNDSSMTAKGGGQL